MLESSGVEGETNAEDSLWQELTGHLLEQRAVVCPHCDLPPTCTLIHRNSKNHTAVVEVGCISHGRICELMITQPEFAAAHESLYGERV